MIAMLPATGPVPSPFGPKPGEGERQIEARLMVLGVRVHPPLDGDDRTDAEYPGKYRRLHLDELLRETPEIAVIVDTFEQRIERLYQRVAALSEDEFKVIRLILREALTGGFRDMEPPSGAPRGWWPGLVWVSAGMLANAALLTTIGFLLGCTLCYLLAGQGLRQEHQLGQRRAFQHARHARTARRRSPRRSAPRPRSSRSPPADRRGPLRPHCDRDARP